MPSLGALKAFEVAARRGSFALAATELSVTQSAVSHQIRALEAQLGFALFVREGRGLRLTPAGQELAVQVNSALRDIGRSIASLQARANPRRLTVTTMPSFAARWLAPRIGRFIETHPDIELNVVSTNLLLDFSRDGIDVAIRYGLGHYPEHEQVEALLEEEILVVASPQLLAQGRPARPSELRSLPLLRADGEYWQPWFAHVGLDWPEPSTGLLFNDSALVLQAAIDGRGVALTRLRLCERDLASGALVQLFPQTVYSGRKYWFVTPAKRKLSPLGQRFREWLFAEAKASAPIAANPADGVALDPARW